MYCLEYYVLFLKFHVLSCYIYTRYIKKLLLMIIQEAHGMQSDMSFLALLIVFFLQKHNELVVLSLLHGANIILNLGLLS